MPDITEWPRMFAEMDTAELLLTLMSVRKRMDDVAMARRFMEEKDELPRFVRGVKYIWYESLDRSVEVRSPTANEEAGWDALRAEINKRMPIPASPVTAEGNTRCSAQSGSGFQCTLHDDHGGAHLAQVRTRQTLINISWG